MGERLTILTILSDNRADVDELVRLPTRIMSMTNERPKLCATDKEEN